MILPVVIVFNQCVVWLLINVIKFSKIWWVFLHYCRDLQANWKVNLCARTSSNVVCCGCFVSAFFQRKWFLGNEMREKLHSACLYWSIFKTEVLGEAKTSVSWLKIKKIKKHVQSLLSSADHLNLETAPLSLRYDGDNWWNIKVPYECLLVFFGGVVGFH